MVPEPFFLRIERGRPGQRFALYFAAESTVPHGAVVFVHPFAEEMNKSRRMAGLQARSMARAGYSVLLIDLLGCGDSSGDFGDASWDDWIEDIVLACDWLQVRAAGPLWVWGMRAGCLLAAAAARRMARDCRLLFWQPATSGQQILRQFLRTKAAADLADGGVKAVMDSLRSRLEAGEAVDVAGYRLSPALALGLDSADLAPVPGVVRLECLELSTRPDAGPSPAVDYALRGWSSTLCRVRTQVVLGPSFWNTIDIEDAPTLVAATDLAMADGGSAAA